MYSENLVAINNPKSPVAESYRIIRSNIQFSYLDQPLKRFLITSSGPSEGKSVTSANLAATFAQTGQKVVLVDCDMRKPTQHKIFDLPNIQGVTNILLGDVAIEEALQETSEERLKLITTGPLPPNPAEMMGSQRMADFLEALEDYADLIILDTPPIVAVTDAALLSRQVDGVVLVIGSGVAKIDMAKKAKEMLLNAQARIIGTVLNMVQEDSQDYYYYYSYYGEGNNKNKRKKSDKVASL